MTYHLVATATVLPTLKSARDFCSKPRVPQIIASNYDPQIVYARAREIGGNSRIFNELQGCINGLPVFQTGDWTYHIVSDS